MSRKNFAVPVKLWALLCAIIGISLTANPILNCVLTLTGFFYLVFQKNIRFLRSCLVFYGVLAFLLYLIRFQGFHMVLFSEFYVLMFWNMFPVFLVGWDLLTTPPGELAAFLSKIRMPAPFILGLLVMFRFFSDYEGRTEKRLAVHEKPGAYDADKDFTASSDFLRIRSCSLPAALYADCRPAFRFCGGKRCGMSRKPGKLL